MNEGKPAPIEALLFDLGGVVIEIDFDRVLRYWEPCSGLDFGQMRARLRIDATYRQHERGEIDSPRFFAHLRQVFELEASDREIARGWNAVFAGEITETLETIRTVRSRLPCFALTNTTPSHQATWSAAFPKIVATFERVFSSPELGSRKPEREAFELVSREIGASPSTILFFDDTLENVEGARAAGLHAVHVRSPLDIEQALSGIGVLNRR